MIGAQASTEGVEQRPVFTVGTVELRRADETNPSLHDEIFMDELAALSDKPQIWARRVEADEVSGLATGWLWVMYSDGSGLYMRVLTDASLYWASAPQEEINQLGAFILAGLHQVQLKVLSPFGVVGHA